MVSQSCSYAKVTDQPVKGWMLRSDVRLQVIGEASLHFFALGAILSLFFPANRTTAHARISGEIPATLSANRI